MEGRESGCAGGREGGRRGEGRREGRSMGAREGWGRGTSPTRSASTTWISLLLSLYPPVPPPLRLAFIPRDQRQRHGSLAPPASLSLPPSLTPSFSLSLTRSAPATWMSISLSPLPLSPSPSLCPALSLPHSLSLTDEISANDMDVIGQRLNEVEELTCAQSSCGEVDEFRLGQIRLDKIRLG